MEELKCLRSSRRGYRSHLFKTFTSALAILEGDPSASLKEQDEVMLSNTLEQLQRKKDILCDLDKRIAACITDEGELETEIYEAEETQSSILDTIAKIKFFLRPRPPNISPASSGTQNDAALENVSNTENAGQSVPQSERYPIR